MTPASDFYSEKKGGYTLVRLPGRVTRENISQIENRIETIVAENKANIVLDLSTTRDIFSIFITLIMQIKNQVSGVEGKLYLVKINESCLAQLKSMNLDKVLSIYESEEDVKGLM